MVYPPESIIRLPLLEFAKDGKIHSIDEAEEHLAKFFNLSDEIRQQLKPSGRERLFLHKLRWSRTDLRIAGLITDPKVAHFQITERGLHVLQNPPKVLTDKFLSQFPEYDTWRRRKKGSIIYKFFSKQPTITAKTEEKREEQFRKLEQRAARRIKNLPKGEIDSLIEQVENNKKEKPQKKAKISKSKRHERDPNLAALMKEKWNHTCQICAQRTFEDKYGNWYTESHHIFPRAKGGPDISNNILVVCPTCHRIFDSGSEESKLKNYLIIKQKKLFSDFEILKQKKIISNYIYNQLKNHDHK